MRKRKPPAVCNPAGDIGVGERAFFGLLKKPLLGIYRPAGSEKTYRLHTVKPQKQPEVGEGSMGILARVIDFF